MWLGEGGGGFKPRAAQTLLCFRDDGAARAAPSTRSSTSSRPSPSGSSSSRCCARCSGACSSSSRAAFFWRIIGEKALCPLRFGVAVVFACFCKRAGKKAAPLAHSLSKNNPQLKTLSQLYHPRDQWRPHRDAQRGLVRQALVLEAHGARAPVPCFLFSLREREGRPRAPLQNQKEKPNKIRKKWRRPPLVSLWPVRSSLVKKIQRLAPAV
jgi:hypothetical protein